MRVAKSMQESILVAFDFIWKVMLSDINFSRFATVNILPKVFSLIILPFNAALINFVNKH